MHSYEIVKEAFTLPFRAYKGFILVSFLFFVSEIAKEIINQVEIEHLTAFKLGFVFLLSIIILGICIGVVYHYIYDSFNIRNVSITTTTKVGFKDTFIETYYYILTILGSIIISYALGIYDSIRTNISNVFYAESKIESLTLVKLIKYMSPDVYQNLALSVIATIAIFVILFAILFSYCSFAKIRLRETNDLKESMNFIKLTQIIIRKGIIKYMKFVILTLIVFAAVLLIARTLETYLIFGSVISAMAEAFALFFILDSFCLFYYS